MPMSWCQEFINPNTAVVSWKYCSILPFNAGVIEQFSLTGIITISVINFSYLMTCCPGCCLFSYSSQYKQVSVWIYNLTKLRLTVFLYKVSFSSLFGIVYEKIKTFSISNRFLLMEYKTYGGRTHSIANILDHSFSAALIFGAK